MGPLGVHLIDEKTGAQIPRRSFAHAEQIGRRAARIAVAALQDAQPEVIDRLEVKVKLIDLPIGNPSFRLGKAIQSTPRTLYTHGEPDDRTEPVAKRMVQDPALRAWVARLIDRVGPVAELIKALPFQLGEDLLLYLLNRSTTTFPLGENVQLTLDTSVLGDIEKAEFIPSHAPIVLTQRAGSVQIDLQASPAVTTVRLMKR